MNDPLSLRFHHIPQRLRKLAIEMADIGADMELLGALDPVGNHGRTLIAQGKQAMEWSKELERS